MTPRIIFIVPYRDRQQQYLFFRKQIKYVLEDMPEDDYKILYIHQCDQRGFNRGALKNIGFLFVKNTYPETYHNITLVFNDVDTIPYEKNFINYETHPGKFKHFYGFKYALGGIVSICACDFEKINGFPNYWAWGYEDNALQDRALEYKIEIDRSQFYPLMDKNIMHFGDGFEKEVNRKEFDRFLNKSQEGIYSLTGLVYDFEEETGFVQVRDFHTGTIEDTKLTRIHDIRSGPRPYKEIRRNSSVGGNSIFPLAPLVRGRPMVLK